MARLSKKNGSGGTGPIGGTGHPTYRFPTVPGPPAGTYDPGLDAQVRASQRGLLDLIHDSHRDTRRDRHDLGTELLLSNRKFRRSVYSLKTDRRRGLGDIHTQSYRGHQDIGMRRHDLGRDFTRDLSDLALARQRGDEDYNRTLDNMQRSYAVKAFVDAEHSAQAGTSNPGDATDANGVAIRAANQAYDKTGIDTDHARLLQDLGIKGSRLTADHREALNKLGITERRLTHDTLTDKGRLLADFLNRRHQLGQDTRTQNRLYHQDFRRTNRDRWENVSRAKREQGIYATDVSQQEYYQAHQNHPHIKFPSPDGTGSGNTPGVGASGPGSGGVGLPGGANPHPAIARRIRQTLQPIGA